MDKKERPKAIHVQAQIEYRRLSELKPNPKNPRKSTKEAVEKLAESIKNNPTFFEARPILLSDRTGELVIIGGERRSEAAKLLGLTFVPTILLHGLAEAEEDEIMIKDNTHAGVWDEQKLQSWGKEQLQSWNVEGVKWPKEQPPVKEDDFDKPVDTVCKKGDIWRLGNHRLMCGDSTDAGSVALLMDGDKADMCFTDPPYGVSIGTKNKLIKEKVAGGVGNAITEDIENDTLPSEELYKVLVAAMNNIRENCKDDASYYVTSPPGGELGLIMLLMMKDAGLPVRHILIWEKNAPTFSIGRLDYDYQHEPIFYTWTKSHHCYRQGEYRSTIWKYDKRRKCDIHPTMKPVALVANSMKDSTKEGDLVVDFFGGSGTTLIAAEQLNRKCYMMELDPHYCDVIIARWEKLTGQKAIKIN